MAKSPKFELLIDKVDEEPAEKSIIVGVLKDLGVTDVKANKSATDHLSRLSATRTRHAEHGLTLDDAILLSDAVRVGDMIKKWNVLQEIRRKIFQPRIQFERIINELFSDKELHFDARNVPTVHLQSGEEVQIGVLSSGEKQLFIFLGQAVLQEGKPVVFISDEPELSLHVSWQNTLVKNIRSLNEACQVITATHSPDIVGSFQDRVIKVEDCFQ